jgi:uncharacterized protein (TIGR03083 family)
VVSALRSAPNLESPSKLPGWSLLTIACHLRYGARATHRMTTEGLAGLTTSFYPEGRSSQRPATLHPDPGEHYEDVVVSLGEEIARLHDVWAQLSDSYWATELQEPDGNRDLGQTTLADLALLRLTEVEVHGSDLGLGLDDWSRVFVSAALPARIGWLATRRSNHRAVDREVQGSWGLVAGDGACWRVEVSGDQVTIEAADRILQADCEIRGSSRDLLAMLLGRSTTDSLTIRGDVGLARKFAMAFPGP